MVYEHEIPKGARLYFGKSAKLKRDIERIASELFYKEGFEEIVTPLFSYHQHKLLEDETELIWLGDEKNRKLTIRADSTIDVVRLITNRLGRSTEHKRWFYIQSIFRYPTKEFYQIGAEVLDSQDVVMLLKIVLKFFDAFDIVPTLQISNIKIPHLLSSKYSLPLDVLKSMDVDKILENEHSWMEKLLYLSAPDQIDDLLGVVPEDIEAELLKMKSLSEAIEYHNIILSPLYYAKMRYYKGLFFRFFEENATLAMGGEYVEVDLEASGFALYVDEIINSLEKVVNGS